MNLFIARYVFSNKKEFLSVWDRLKLEHEEQEKPFFHSFQTFGNPIISNAITDEEGNEIIPTVYNTNEYLVNVIYRGLETTEEGKGIQPEEMKPFYISPKNPLFYMWGTENIKDSIEL